MMRTLREIMVTDLVSFKPRTNIHAAIHTLLAHGYSGAPVSEYMSVDVQTLDPDLDLVSCAKRFIESPFRRFPIVENGQLIGQVSRHDILKSLSEDLKRN